MYRQICLGIIHFHPQVSWLFFNHVRLTNQNFVDVLRLVVCSLYAIARSTATDSFIHSLSREKEKDGAGGSGGSAFGRSGVVLEPRFTLSSPFSIADFCFCPTTTSLFFPRALLDF